MHISGRMRRIALHSAIGGHGRSMIGMALASGGLLSPVAGALSQEVIDVFAIFNALRAAIRPKELSDFGPVASAAPVPDTALPRE
jgi:cation transport ATPase